MSKEERYELIEQYLGGDLPAAERDKFDRLLQADQALRSELLLHQELHDALGNQELRSFEKLVRQAGEDYIKKNEFETPGPPIKYWQMAAAVLVLLVAGIGLYLATHREPDAEQLFAAYFTPYEVPGNLRSEETSVTSQVSFSEGLSSYSKGQFQEAVVHFNEAVKENPDQMMAVFLRGVSYLHIGNVKLAEEDLKAVIADKNNLFSDQAKWYLALNYLKQERLEEAKSLLEELSKENHLKASELNEQL